MNQNICLGDIIIDCDDAQKLRGFYVEPLGWKI